MTLRVSALGFITRERRSAWNEKTPAWQKGRRIALYIEGAMLFRSIVMNLLPPVSIYGGFCLLRGKYANAKFVVWCRMHGDILSNKCDC